MEGRANPETIIVIKNEDELDASFKQIKTQSIGRKCQNANDYSKKEPGPGKWEKTYIDKYTVCISSWASTTAQRAPGVH